MLTLKNVKIHNDMSEETTCFSASVYVNGKRAGDVRNNGRGGAHVYYWTDRKLGEQAKEWAEKQPHEFKFEHLDQEIDKLLHQWEDRQLVAWLRKKAGKGTLFRLKGDRKGSWLRESSPYDKLTRDRLAQEFGDKLECIANEDFEAAVAYC